MSGCPRDTNGDGDCGQVACPDCGPYAEDYARLAKADTAPSVANGHWEGGHWAGVVWVEHGCTTCAAGNAATFHRHTTAEPT